VTFGVVRALNAYGDPAPGQCSPGGRCTRCFRSST
jgi:hypothetical protein